MPASVWTLRNSQRGLTGKVSSRVIRSASLPAIGPSRPSAAASACWSATRPRPATVPARIDRRLISRDGSPGLCMGGAPFVDVDRIGHADVAGEGGGPPREPILPPPARGSTRVRPGGRVGARQGLEQRVVMDNPTIHAYPPVEA